MKKILFLFFGLVAITVAPVHLFSQKNDTGIFIGTNSEGFFQNIDSLNSLQARWYFEANENPVLRLPSGGRAKFMQPFTYRNGWGMDSNFVRAWFAAYPGRDENGDEMENVLRLVSMQPARSYMDDLVELQKLHPGMMVIWVANIFTDPSETINTLHYLISRGVVITGVELGNECYGPLDNFNQFLFLAEPVRDEILKNFPGLKISIPCANFWGRKEEIKWHEDLMNYAGIYDAVTIHFYPGESQMPDFNLLPTPGVYEYPNRDLQHSFENICNYLVTENLFDNWIDSCDRLFPEKEIWITEFNTKPSNAIGNTFTNGAWLFKKMVEIPNEKVKYMCPHNGLASADYGIISRSQPQDLVQTDYVKRTGYFSYELASEILGEDPVAISLDDFIDTAGTFTYYFINPDSAFSWIIGNDIAYQVDSIQIKYVQAKYLYSSAGRTGWQSRNSNPSYEINSVIDSVTTNYMMDIPAISYGYLKVYTSIKQPVVNCPKVCGRPIIRIFFKVCRKCGSH